MKFKISDQVIITAGKDKGKTGEITKIFPGKQKLTVKGANIYKRHVKARDGIEGGIVPLERPLPTANIAILCPTCKKPTRAGYNLPPKGDKVRICKKCGSGLDKKQDSKSKAKK